MYSYIIRVIQNGEILYLFNSRMLVHEIRLARRFVSIAAAKRFSRHVDIPVDQMDIIPDIGGWPDAEHLRAL